MTEIHQRELKAAGIHTRQAAGLLSTLIIELYAKHTAHKEARSAVATSENLRQIQNICSIALTLEKAEREIKEILEKENQ